MERASTGTLVTLISATVRIMELWATNDVRSRAKRASTPLKTPSTCSRAPITIEACRHLASPLIHRSLQRRGTRRSRQGMICSFSRQPHLDSGRHHRVVTCASRKRRLMRSQTTGTIICVLSRRRLCVVRSRTQVSGRVARHRLGHFVAASSRKAARARCKPTRCSSLVAWTR